MTTHPGWCSEWNFNDFRKETVTVAELDLPGALDPIWLITEPSKGNFEDVRMALPTFIVSSAGFCNGDMDMEVKTTLSEAATGSLGLVFAYQVGTMWPVAAHC